MSYNFIEIGNTRKATGFDGAIRLEIADHFLEDLMKAEAVFIETGFEILPYFPKSIKNDGHVIARFDDVLDREAATALAGRTVYLRTEEVNSQVMEPVKNDLDLDVLVGIVVHDENIGEIGPILSIESFPQQEMMKIDYNGRPVLVPLHPDLVIDMVPGEKLVMNLPKGILDI